MSYQPDKLYAAFDAATHVLSLLVFAVAGVMLLIHLIVTFMARASKQQDDVEQLALKFSHKK